MSLSEMNPKFNYIKLRHAYLYFMVFIFSMAFHGCQKETLLDENRLLTGVNVYDDTSIRIPLQVIAGKGTLLSAYYTSGTPVYRFMLTDNNGKHKWTKEFGITTLKGMIAEDDGTFTLFDNTRLLNIDINGNILKDIPNFLADIGGYIPIHVMLTTNGNYLFYGRVSVTTPYAFAFEIAPSGITVFKKVYLANTLFTGCQQTPDGSYLFLGNFYPNNSGSLLLFFICKMDGSGNVSWIKYHSPPGRGASTGGTGNIFYTHDILETNAGNYLCFVGSSNIDVTNAARIYKVTPEGDLLDSTDINFGKRNIFAGPNLLKLSSYSDPIISGFCAAKNAGGTNYVYLNYRQLEDSITATTIFKENQSFSMRINDDLSVQHIGYIQTSFSDYISAVCTTSDGKIAAFGFISSFGSLNKPIILISE